MELISKTRPKKNNWIPTKQHHSIETFIEATRNEIQQKIEKNTTIEIFDPNRSRTESNARNAIKKRHSNNQGRQSWSRCNPR